jgi:hypothetical protein
MSETKLKMYSSSWRSANSWSGGRLYDISAYPVRSRQLSETATKTLTLLARSDTGKFSSNLRVARVSQLHQIVLAHGLGELLSDNVVA